MPVRCQRVIQLMEKLAPHYIAEKGDPIGLQIGDPHQEVEKILVSLDLDEAVLAEAEEWGADLLILHHTPLWKPLHNIRTDSARGSMIARIIRNGMALYTAHTNLDSAQGGVNEILAQRLGLLDTAPIANSWEQKLFKLAVFVPESHCQVVREALAASGAGWIGNYSSCTFRVKGIGTFLPLEGADPFIGSQGKLEEVQEVRIETIAGEEILDKVVKAMLQAHPYEEVAYDLYPLHNKGERRGLGRVGYLAEATSLKDFLILVKEKLGLDLDKYCGRPEQRIKKVALCGGAGASLLPAAIHAGADVFLTGDIKYHEAQEAVSHNLALIDAGHFATEYPVVPVVAEYLQGELQEDKVQVKASSVNTDPFCYL